MIPTEKLPGVRELMKIEVGLSFGSAIQTSGKYRRTKRFVAVDSLENIIIDEYQRIKT